MMIIIGLAGSGKTSYYHEKLSNDYELYDDFISNPFDIEEINDRMCLIDPRLCDFKIFQDIMSNIEKYIDKTKINLILFENNPEKCLINSKNRLNKNVENMINIYSKKYKLTNYYNYNYEIVKVFE